MQGFGIGFEWTVFTAYDVVLILYRVGSLREFERHEPPLTGKQPAVLRHHDWMKQADGLDAGGQGINVFLPVPMTDADFADRLDTGPHRRLDQSRSSRVILPLVSIDPLGARQSVEHASGSCTACSGPRAAPSRQRNTTQAHRSCRAARRKCRWPTTGIARKAGCSMRRIAGQRHKLLAAIHRPKPLSAVGI